MMRWESIAQPLYTWLGDEWYNPKTKESYIAFEIGWKHKRYGWYIDYDYSSKVFGL